MKNNGIAGAVAFKCVVYFQELIFPTYEVFDVVNIREAEGD
jgi:hypothetical protein